MSNLAAHISQTCLIDTHEHLSSEQQFVAEGPDLLQDLFDNYVAADLLVAGASEDAVRRLLDASDPDLAGQLTGVRDVWQRCRHTGYGEAHADIREGDDACALSGHRRHSWWSARHATRFS